MRRGTLIHQDICNVFSFFYSVLLFYVFFFEERNLPSTFSLVFLKTFGASYCPVLLLHSNCFQGITSVNAEQWIFSSLK